MNRVTSVIAMVTALTMVFAMPALAHDESGNWSCGTNDHVYTKIRYHDGYTESYIDGDGDDTDTHQSVAEDEWVNRYHQPRLGGSAYYELREETAVMSHTYSWPGCED